MLIYPTISNCSDMNVPYTFNQGDKAKAAEINSNFTSSKQSINDNNNRINNNHQNISNNSQEILINSQSATSNAISTSENMTNISNKAQNILINYHAISALSQSLANVDGELSSHEAVVAQNGATYSYYSVDLYGMANGIHGTFVAGIDSTSGLYHRSGDETFFYLPIHLPHGAYLDWINVFYYDSTSDSHVAYELFEGDITSYERRAVVGSITDDSGAQHTSHPFIPDQYQIDNINYGYFFEIRFASWAPGNRNVGIKGIRFMYHTYN